MGFNEEQTKEIYEFVMRYNSDETYRKETEEIYDKNLSKLSILQIYALEVVLRYGTKDIFSQFIASKGTCSEEEAIKLFDNFMRLLDGDEKFKQYKLEQLATAKETLSEMEVFAFSLLPSEKLDEENKQSEESTTELEYDELTPIRYATDKQIRETLENLLFGKFIHNALELPIMSEIKSRQRESGVIANSDKPVIIGEIRKLLVNDVGLYKETVDRCFIRVKYQILLGKGEEAFAEFLEYNTNISADEIFGREKETTEEDIYQFFQDLVNKRKNQEEKSPRK